MTYEKAIRIATNKVLKDNKKVIVLNNDCIFGSDYYEKGWHTIESENCIPSNIIVSEIVVHKSILDNYWVKQKQLFVNKRFANTITVVE